MQKVMKNHNTVKTFTLQLFVGITCLKPGADWQKLKDVFPVQELKDIVG